jgi:phosphoribosylformylglycinamidine synthase subunit PurS
LKVRVLVTLKPSVFDPQGRAIVEALHSLGYDKAADARQGKYFLLDLDVKTAAEAETLATEIAGRVLANPVIESFTIEVADATIEVADATIEVDGAGQ